MTPDDCVRRLLAVDSDALAWCAVRGHAPEKLAALLDANYHRIVGEISRNFATLERTFYATAERLGALGVALDSPPAQRARPLRHHQTLRSSHHAKA